ncbi:hypothetical protein KAX97_04235, partial [candidate division WOR-3 bacterium]|nr:hypothetical protein [candidate division WOR-3 bacterium]
LTGLAGSLRSQDHYVRRITTFAENAFFYFTLRAEGDTARSAILAWRGDTANLDFVGVVLRIQLF